MTCIVGLKHKGVVYMGADSAIGSGTDSIAKANWKVFKNGPYVIGVTGYSRMTQILEHATKLPKPGACITTADADRHAFKVANRIMKVLLKQKFATDNSNRVDAYGVLLIAWKQHLYRIEGNFQYTRYREDYTAVGCGEDYALGSLYSNGQLEPRERIRQALQAASHFGGAVKPPFQILTTE